MPEIKRKGVNVWTWSEDGDDLEKKQGDVKRSLQMWTIRSELEGVEGAVATGLDLWNMRFSRHPWKH
jgi:hypothetical protein